MSPVVAAPLLGTRRPRAGVRLEVLNVAERARPNQQPEGQPVPGETPTPVRRPQPPPLPRITPGTWPLSPRRQLHRMTHAEDNLMGTHNWGHGNRPKRNSTVRAQHRRRCPPRFCAQCGSIRPRREA